MYCKILTPGEVVRIEIVFPCIFANVMREGEFLQVNIQYSVETGAFYRN